MKGHILAYNSLYINRKWFVNYRFEIHFVRSWKLNMINKISKEHIVYWGTMKYLYLVFLVVAILYFLQSLNPDLYGSMVVLIA